MIMKQPQTYIQAAQRNAATNNAGNHFNHSENRIKKRIEKLKYERAKTEVLLTTYKVSDNIKNQLTNMSEKVFMNNLQQVITVTGKEQVKIRRV